MTKAKKIFFLVLGCIGLGLGVVGAIVPLLPAFPFLLLAAISFAKSSEKLHNWFLNTKLYKNDLEPFLHKKGMTWGAKIRAMIVLTITLGVGVFMVRHIPIVQIILAVVWVFHIILFVFIIKTRKIEQEKKDEDISSSPDRDEKES